MELIINGFTFKLNNETQYSKKGRPFRLSSIFKHEELGSKFIDRVEKWCWCYRFIFLDEAGGFLTITTDYNDKFLKYE